MRVLKFGGTSVGTPESLTNVIKIVEAITEPAIVVVSALGGITDMLINTAKMAAAGDKAYTQQLEIIIKRHREMIDKMVIEENKRATLEMVEELLSQISDIYRGISLINELSQRSLDVIVSFGERMSSIIAANAIKGAVHKDSLQIMKTEKWFNKNIADTTLTNELLVKHLSQVETGHPVVMGGFIARDRDTDYITNLGRGGSDYTAALVAAALNADVLEIWTDVDGFMSADPRIIPNAKVMDDMSFVESMELCSFGAKVIYPPTIYPVFHKNIPIRILNTFNPGTPGTWITDKSNDKDAPAEVKGVTSVKETTLISVTGPNIANLADYNARIFNTLAKHGIQVLLVSQADPEEKITFALTKADAAEALRLLNEEFAPELTSGKINEMVLENETSVIAVVGEKINQIENINGKIFHTLGKEGVNVLASAAGISQTTITLAVPANQTTDTLRLLHAEFIG
jgi:aspartokinase/homoserine dehydrogenase 1